MVQFRQFIQSICFARWLYKLLYNEKKLKVRIAFWFRSHMVSKAFLKCKNEHLSRVFETSVRYSKLLLTDKRPWKYISVLSGSQVAKEKHEWPFLASFSGEVSTGLSDASGDYILFQLLSLVRFHFPTRFLRGNYLSTTRFGQSSPWCATLWHPNGPTNRLDSERSLAFDFDPQVCIDMK